MSFASGMVSSSSHRAFARKNPCPRGFFFGALKKGGECDDERARGVSSRRLFFETVPRWKDAMASRRVVFFLRSASRSRRFM